MLTKRIIPCLDCHGGRTVKGVRFENLIDAGDPAELAACYCDEGADELVFLDISATNENRDTLIELVRNVAASINIPFTVGGGIRTLSDVTKVLSAGADKISINSAGVQRPQLIEEVATRFGNQCVVVAIDTLHHNGEWLVHINGGKSPTKMTAVDWAIEAESRGAGELLVTSMDRDGTKQGFAIELIRTISDSVNIPVIASGGAGKKEHFYEVLSTGNASAALAASLFHLGNVSLSEVKQYLALNGINIRQ